MRRGRVRRLGRRGPLSPPPTRTLAEAAAPPAAVLDGPAPADTHPDCARCPARCCHALDVHLTAADLERITAATGRPPADYARLTPVPRSTPDSLLLSPDGPEAELLLRRDHPELPGPACVFLEVVGDAGHARCGIYDARPAICRAYPFFPRGDADVTLLTVDADALCPAPLLDPARVPAEALLPGLGDKESERAAHRALINRWNRTTAAADEAPAATVERFAAWLLAASEAAGATKSGA